MVLCPICNAKVDTKVAARTLPFCSDRCRNVDLSRWLDERYGLPWEPDPESEPWDEEGEDGTLGRETADNPAPSRSIPQKPSK